MSVAGDGSTEPLLDLASPFWRAIFYRDYSAKQNMVDIAQLVSAADCGSEGRGFESHYPPHKNKTHPFGGVLFLCAEWDSNHQMQQSGGLLLAGGWTTATL